jgi:hypothetical protein
VYVVPALGDIDGDGTVEILAATHGAGFATDSQVIAYEHDGTHKWTSPVLINHGQGFAIALADRPGARRRSVQPAGARGPRPRGRRSRGVAGAVPGPGDVTPSRAPA